jgi:bifunctional N-acetylglucosamine-1-phosphate-uridyltransferase/glucosamine-1-phosphate-acetyltransferase GlmU-like protein
MDRILIVPAAGRGSRLGRAEPKALVGVAGRPMLDHLLGLHGAFVDRVVAVVSPHALAAFDAFKRERAAPLELVVQQHATGMLDAILTARDAVSRLEPKRIAITWCDQIAVTAMTAQRLAARTRVADAPDLVFPTFVVEGPYIHFERDAGGRIVGVRQHREGDEMPARGETDIGLFDLSLRVYLTELSEYADRAPAARRTGERNFLPFIPWLAARRPVETFSGVAAVEAVGVNTPDELSVVEAYLEGSGRLG